MENIIINASLNADAEKPHKFSGIAYTGGVISVGGFATPIKIDVNGVEIPDSVPLLAEHKNECKNKLGDLHAIVEDGCIYVEGEITSQTELAKNIVAMAKAGSKFQLSVGLTASEVESDESGEYFNVLKSTLREVSIVPCGADKDTSIIIEAKADINVENNNQNLEGDCKKMDINAEEILNNERNRVAEIKSICNGEHAEIEAAAIKDGWTIEATAKEVVKATRANRPVVTNKTENSEMAIEAGLAITALGEDGAVKAYGENAVKAGMSYKDCGLKDLVKICAARNGYNANGFSSKHIEAALTTTSTLSNILGNVLTKKIYDAYASYDAIAPKVCDVISVPDYKQISTYALKEGDSNGLTEVSETGDNAGTLTEIQFGEAGGTTQAKLYGNVVTLTEQAIINDDANAFFRAGGVLGRRAAMSLDAEFFNKAKTGSTAIYTANTNYFTGSSADTMDFAYAELLKAYNKFIAASEFKPSILIVPAGDELLAKQIIASAEWRDTTTSKQYVTHNPLMNSLTVYGSKMLTAGEWMLLADPKECPAFQLAFVQGQNRPVVEKCDLPYNKLGAAYRVTYRYGVGAIDGNGALLIKPYRASSSSSSSSSSN